jgi:chromosome segregation ATPase
MISDKTIADLKTQVDSLNQKIDEKTRENQVLQTSLAVATERFKNQVDEINTLKEQHEIRLKYLDHEKHQVIDQVSKLQSEITQYKMELSEQAEKYQLVLVSERTLQEESEKRWVQLIDQARSETKNSQKKHEEILRKQNDKIDSFQNNLEKLQDALTATQTTLRHKNETLETQKKLLEKAQCDHAAAITEIAVLKSRLELNIPTKFNKKQLEVAMI